MHIADAEHTNFAEHSFDAIFARETIEYVRNKSSLFKKALVSIDVEEEERHCAYAHMHMTLSLIR